MIRGFLVNMFCLARRLTPCPHGVIPQQTGISHHQELFMARIAVIIVNYNAADLAVAAVESVRARGHGGHQVDIHLVDNASPDGDGAVFAETARARG